MDAENCSLKIDSSFFLNVECKHLQILDTTQMYNFTVHMVFVLSKFLPGKNGGQHACQLSHQYAWTETHIHKGMYNLLYNIYIF